MFDASFEGYAGNRYLGYASSLQERWIMGILLLYEPTHNNLVTLRL